MLDTLLKQWMQHHDTNVAWCCIISFQFYMWHFFPFFIPHSSVTFWNNNNLKYIFISRIVSVCSSLLGDIYVLSQCRSVPLCHLSSMRACWKTSHALYYIVSLERWLSFGLSPESHCKLLLVSVTFFCFISVVILWNGHCKLWILWMPPASCPHPPPSLPSPAHNTNTQTLILSSPLTRIPYILHKRGHNATTLSYAEFMYVIQYDLSKLRTHSLAPDSSNNYKPSDFVVVVVLLFYVHG